MSEDGDLSKTSALPKRTQRLASCDLSSAKRIEGAFVVPDFLFGLKAEGSKVLHLSSPSDGSCFDGPLEAVSLHRL